MSLRSAGNSIHNTAYKWMDNVKIGSTPAYRLHRWPASTTYVVSPQNATDTRIASSFPTISKTNDIDAVAVAQSASYRHQAEYDRDLLRLLSQVGSESKKRGLQINEDLLLAAIVKLKTKHNYPTNKDGSWRVPEEYALGPDGKIHGELATQKLNLRGSANAGGSSGSSNGEETRVENPSDIEAGPVFDSTSGTLIDRTTQTAISLVKSLDTQRDAFEDINKKLKHAEHALKQMEKGKENEKDRDRERSGEGYASSPGAHAGAHAGAGSHKGEPPSQEHRNGASKSSTAVVLSTGRPASSDVRGNLGPASVITSEKTDDWLADRWQAASNMGGTPIPGSHWVEIDLLRLCKVTSILIDWEEAFSQHWILKGKRSDGKCATPAPAPALALALAQSGGDDAGWTALTRSKEAFKPPSAAKYTPKHILQAANIQDNHTGTGDTDDCSAPYYDKVRLVIFKPSTRFGSSIWRLQIKGFEA